MLTAVHSYQVNRELDINGLYGPVWKPLGQLSAVNAAEQRRQPYKGKHMQ
jgi:hypothetical protein